MLLNFLFKVVLSASLWIALPNKNMNIIEELVMNRSNPEHVDYGKYMSIEQITDITSTTNTDDIYQWLKGSNITQCKTFSNYIKCTDSLKKYMLHCNIKTLTHPCNIPSHLIKSIILIDGLDPNLKPQWYGHHQYMNEGYITRDVLKRLYNINDISLPSILASVGIAEFQNNNGFLNSELTEMEIENNIVNHTVSHKHTIGNNIQPTDLESDLDISMIAQVSGNTSELWYWNNVEWLFAFAAELLTTPNVPNIISISWGWSARDQCSIVPCNDTNAYVKRTNEEFMKIALRGITLLASSGDSGSCGRSNGNCDKCPDGGTSCGIYPLNAVFPTSSPFILSVGGTYLVPDSSTLNYNYTTPVCKYNVSCSNATNEKPSMAPEVGWTSGGGFSNIFIRPYWQNFYIDEYIKYTGVLPNKTYFNSSYRGYPDVTAVSNNCAMILDGEWTTAAGTSCSSPIWGGIIGIINQHQQSKGKPVVGLVAPLLYYIARQKPSCFNIIEGGNTTSTEYNEYCGVDFGFSSTRNDLWSPVSGLGSPNVECILKFLDN